MIFARTFFFVLKKETSSKEWGDIYNILLDLVVNCQNSHFYSLVFSKLYFQKLDEIGSKTDREAYILMERIRAPVQQNYIVRPNIAEATLTTIVSELGIFGAVLG